MNYNYKVNREESKKASQYILKTLLNKQLITKHYNDISKKLNGQQMKISRPNSIIKPCSNTRNM